MPQGTIAENSARSPGRWYAGAFANTSPVLIPSSVASVRSCSGKSRSSPVREDTSVSIANGLLKALPSVRHRAREPIVKNAVRPETRSRTRN